MLLDLYVLKKFLTPFFYSIVGFIAIWFVWDLSSNAPDFIQGHITFVQLIQFYLTQIPEVIVLSLPVAILLALLYSFTQMSRHNEIISMLCSGRSLYRIFCPLMFVGLVFVVVVTYFNYQQAPQAKAIKDQLKDEMRTGIKSTKILKNHLFRNRIDNRTWYLQALDVTHQKAYQLQIIQQDAEGNIVEKWYITNAAYNPATHTWLFSDVNHVVVDAMGEIVSFDHADQREVHDWSESPWRIGSSAMDPNVLGVPELKEYLAHNSDFSKVRLAPFITHLYYRWSLPWTCLIVIFIAAPLGVIYSRRSILGGISLAVGLFAALLFADNLFLALGKGARCFPIIAAWGPNLIFLGIGCYLVWIKATGRELPKIKLPWAD
ncbi:MAG: YjgP/YjgQ family permease [Verrucomicrobia bacterium]|nr:YjgP/YjgQ family permease [Verrucomicrobiota bacterium]